MNTRRGFLNVITLQLRIVFLIAIFNISGAALFAQGAPPAPTAQPTVQTTPAPSPASGRKSLTEQEKQKEVAELDRLISRYGSKGNWYLVVYYIFVLGGALAAALAGLILQWDTPEKSYKRKAQLLAFVGSALAVVTTSVNFKVQAVANKTAYMEFRELKNKVTAGEVTDKPSIDRESIEIEKRKTALALK